MAGITLYIKNKKIATIGNKPIYSKFVLPEGTRYFVVKNLHAWSSPNTARHDNGDWLLFEKSGSGQEDLSYFNNPNNVIDEHYPTVVLGYTQPPIKNGSCLVDVTLENQQLTVGSFKAKASGLIRNKTPEIRTEQYFEDIVIQYLQNE